MNIDKIDSILLDFKSDNICIKEAKRMIYNLSSKYAIIRWYSNTKEDVVCANTDIANRFVETYNKKAGEKLCYLDTEVCLPLDNHY